MKQELINYIEKEKKQGFPAERIKDALLKAGYTKKTADEHLNYVYKETVNKSNKGKLIILSFIILIIIFGSGFYYYFKVMPANKLQNYIDDGHHLYNKGDFKGAIEQFNKAVILDPENEFLYRVLGWSYYYLEKDDKAIENFEKAISINLGDDSSYIGLTLYHYKEGNYKDALDYITKAENINEITFSMKLIKGGILTKLKEYEKAEELLNGLKAYEREESYCALWSAIGILEFEKGNIESSKHNYYKTLEINPNCSRFRSTMTRELKELLNL